MTKTPSLFTIGHSDHKLDALVDLLRAAGVSLLVDVRSAPWSRYVPQFNRENLQRSLTHTQVDYCFLGDKLGGRPDDPGCYDEVGHVLYYRLAVMDSFREGIRALEDLATQQSTAIMCAEEDPTDCHRRLLVAKVLHEGGTAIRHIRRDGRIESELGVAPAPTLFDQGEEWWRSTQSVLRRSRQRNSFAA